jgi:hypothetical protein
MRINAAVGRSAAIGPEKCWKNGVESGWKINTTKTIDKKFFLGILKSDSLRGAGRTGWDDGATDG